MVVRGRGWIIRYKPRQSHRKRADIYPSVCMGLARPHLVWHGQSRDDQQHPANGLLLRRTADATTPRHMAGRIYRHSFGWKWSHVEVDVRR